MLEIIASFLMIRLSSFRLIASDFAMRASARRVELKILLLGYRDLAARCGLVRARSLFHRFRIFLGWEVSASRFLCRCIGFDFCTRYSHLTSRFSSRRYSASLLSPFALLWINFAKAGCEHTSDSDPESMCD